ncbi:extended synaptotagmin-like protein [Perkinsus olseni]|uniref:Extended synaptotagmin-like protein n=1 Tax=Perkinsus olseni TaxID=32597 RepID=A0A7J6R631_PEROL|nr:extended synaptotagmin-like protein [Perkinsus olseni]KAF4743363.1 extended synaptotagmin-like protein [Perkinsus olseni]
MVWWLADVLWFNWLQPIVMDHILPIIMWQSWLKSLAALVGYILASYYAAYWPAFACWITAAFMIRNKTLKGYDRFMANKSMTSALDGSGKLVLLEVEEAADDDVGQQEFGGLIKTFTRMSPGWVKEMAAGFQPTVKTIVDGVALARNIILWKHELSKKAFYGLLAGGVVLCFLPFWILVMAAGAGVLLANSPIKGLSIGLAKYAARPAPTGDIGLLDAMEEHHHSADYKTLVVQKQRTKTKDTTASETPPTTGRTSSPPQALRGDGASLQV